MLNKINKRKVVLVTGISSVLGSLVSEKFLENGFVVYGVSREKPKINKIKYLKLDITSDASCKRTINNIIKDENRIDVVVNIAGVTLSGDLLKYSPNDYLRLLDINVVGAYRLMQLVIPHMKKQKSGKIINITSLNGLVAFPGFSIYSSSKHAIEALGIAASYELSKENIFITNIAPGAIETGVKTKSKLMHKPAREKFKLLHLMLPMVKSHQVADKVVEVASLDEPPTRIILGRDAWFIYSLQRILPLTLWNNLMLFVWQKS